MKKLLFVYSCTCSKDSAYIVQALRRIPTDKMVLQSVSIENYLAFDDSEYDYLIYNSFAAEEHPLKFNKEIVYKTDEKYHKFKGKKLLLDSHDDGTLDSYARFNDKVQPRIKYTPGYEYSNEFNIVAEIPIKVRSVHVWRGEEKTISLVYCGNKRGFLHSVRVDTANRLSPFNPNMTWYRSMNVYGRILRAAKISVATPGWGPIGSAHNEALSAAAVLFSYESVKKVKILPFAELEDGQNYVSYNFDNLEEKLSWLLANEDEIKRIRLNGRKTFDIGYDVVRTANLITDYFLEN
jgi:hypothetical protein